MLFLDGVYIERPDGSLHFCWVRAPTSSELAELTQNLARRIGRFLKRQGLLERDVENSYMGGDLLPDGTAPRFVDDVHGRTNVASAGCARATHLPHRRRAAAGSQSIHAADNASVRRVVRERRR
jgi:hypothetical protein